MAAPPDNARAVAVDALARLEERGLPIDRVFAARADKLDATERRLARSIVFGVLRRRDAVDAAIAQHARHPLDKMEPLVRAALRVGAFQLACLSRIPASAAVNTTVDALKRERGPRWLVGFVNGVLRRLSAERDRLSRFDLDASGLPRTNHPEWLCKRWSAHFGETAMRAICALNNTEPSLSLRINTAKIGRADFLAELKKHGIAARAGRISPVGVVVEGYPGPIATLFGYEAGFFQVQDEGAQLVSMLAAHGLSGPARVLDACAGPGGKTGHLAELLPPGGRVVALEPDKGRYRLLLENIGRLGHTARVEPIMASLEKFAADLQGREKYDAILLDAPCSGTGVIRRRPDIRWNRRPEDLTHHAETQARLLHGAAGLLKPGGLLVYATCSLEPEENGETVEKFLAAHPAYHLEPAAPRLPESARNLARKDCLVTLPTDGCDGFFAACLRRDA